MILSDSVRGEGAEELKSQLWAAIDEDREYASDTLACKSTRKVINGNDAANNKIKTAEVVDPRDMAAMIATRGLAEDLANTVNVSLSTLLDSGVMNPGATVNNTVLAVRSAVEDAVDEHMYTWAEVYAEHAGTTALQQAQKQCLLKMVSVLEPIYRTLVQSMVQGSLAAFDRQVGKLSSARRLPEQLRIISRAIERGFLQGTTMVQREFSDLVAAADRPTDASKQSKPQQWPQFDAGFELQCLREFLRQRQEDTLCTLTLAGVYNPYVRETPLPPLHVNLNYLLDPKALLVSREYKHLYDEHKEGPCERRADAMHFPGMARVPFNPTEHPVSTEKANRWVDVVKDFFFSKE